MAFDFFSGDPKQQAMLALASGLLESGGPSRQPVSLGQGAARGMLAGREAFMSAQQAQLQKQLVDLKLAAANKTTADEAAKKAWLLSALTQQQPNQVGVSPSSAQVVNAPWASAENLPQSPAGPQPMSQDMLMRGLAVGAPVGDVLKIQDPNLKYVDMGGYTSVQDKMGREVRRMEKTAAPGAKPYEAQDIGAQAYRDFLMGKASASANKNTMNVQNFTPASEEAQKEFMKSTRVNYEAVRNAPSVLKNIEEAKALIPGAKGFMGPGGETLLETAKFLNNRLGMSINTEGIKNAEELRSRVFFQLMENLKKMDAQPSQMQQLMMRDALGKLGTDPNALGSVLDAYGSVIRDKVAIHNREVMGAQERGVKFPYDPVIELRQGQQPQGMGSMPPATQHKGRIIEDSQGNRYQSDGMKWQKQ